MLDGSEIRVLGTRFNVYRKDSGDVVVTVLEGVVEVRGFAQGAARPEWVRRVRANEQMEYRHIGLVDEPHRTDAAARGEVAFGRLCSCPKRVRCCRTCSASSRVTPTSAS